MLSEAIVHPLTAEVKPIRLKPDWKHVSVSLFGSSVAVSIHSITPLPDGTLKHKCKTYFPNDTSLTRLASLVYTLSQRERNVRFTPHQIGLGWNLWLREDN